jgi:hypothetical protein
LAMNESAAYSILNGLEKVKGIAHPPVHLWHPDNVKDIDMHIRANGEWVHEGTVIKRERLVHLFASVLRKEDDNYYLVTPVEKCRILVEDAPFIAILLRNEGKGKTQKLSFTTNMAEEVNCDSDHALRIDIDPDSDEPAPYIHIRDGLEARINRNVFYQLMDLLVTEPWQGKQWLGLWSADQFFPVMLDPS